MNGNKELCVCGMMFFCLFVGCVGEKSCNEDVSEDLLYADFCSRLYAGSITRYEELKAFSCECGLPEAVDILILDARISSALKVEILGSPNVFVSQSVLKKLVKTDKSRPTEIGTIRVG